MTRSERRTLVKSKTFHVWIIPDRNRTWAREKGLSSAEGHGQGAENFKKIFRVIWKMGVSHFTFWGMSLDNFEGRSREEVVYLFGLIESAINDPQWVAELHRKKIQLRVIGEWRLKAPSRIAMSLERLQEETRHYTDRVFTLLFIYNGREEMCEMVERNKRETSVTAATTPDDIAQRLKTAGLPSVDLMIRTGGQKRFSNGALMWLIQDAYIHFSDAPWPEFPKEELLFAIHLTRKQERKSGK